MSVECSDTGRASALHTQIGRTLTIHHNHKSTVSQTATIWLIVAFLYRRIGCFRLLYAPELLRIVDVSEVLETAETHLADLSTI